MWPPEPIWPITFWGANLRNIVDKAKEGIKQVQDGVGALRNALIQIVVLQVTIIALIVGLSAYLIIRLW